MIKIGANCQEAHPPLIEPLYKELLAPSLITYAQHKRTSFNSTNLQTTKLCSSSLKDGSWYSYYAFDVWIHVTIDARAPL